MARIRSIKPEFWTDTFMVQLPPLARLLYVGLWTAADDHGYLQHEPERIAMEVLPREVLREVEAYVDLFIASDRLEVYVTEDGDRYLRIAKWERHQRVDHPAKSRISREGSRKLAIPAAARRAVAEKYGCRPGEEMDTSCYYCGAPGRIHWIRLYPSGKPSSWVVFPGLELDHLEAEAEGGANTPQNLVLACEPCNRRKGFKDWSHFIFDIRSREGSRGLATISGGLAPEGKGKEGKGKEQSLLEHAASLTLLPAPAPSPLVAFILATWPGSKLEPARLATWEGLAREKCPGVDLLAEARAARMWELENPTQVRVNKPSFLGRWFRKEQDKLAGALRNSAPARPGAHVAAQSTSSRPVGRQFLKPPGGAK